jgi:hypothetical protein
MEWRHEGGATFLSEHRVDIPVRLGAGMLRVETSGEWP